MLKNRMATLRWVLLAVFCGVLAIGNALAQGSDPTMSQDSSTQPRQAPDRVEHISKQLNLTPDQKAKLRPMLEQEQKQMMDLRHDPNLTEEQKRAKEKEIHQSFRPQIEGVLTPDQRTKYREARRETVNKRQAGKGQPPPSTTTPPK